VASRGDGRYGLGDLGAAFLGNPGARAMVEHHALLYADLADPVALLRGRDSATGLAGYWPYAGTDDPVRLAAEQVAAYSRLMSISQAMVASEILDAVPLHRHRRLLDVGGGDGTFLEAVAARAPDLDLILFDLPAVAERARARFRDAALEHRACAVGGDFLRDPLPPGADVVSLVRVLHDHDDDRVLRVLRNVRDALPENGTLLLAEPMAGAPAAETVGAYFAFYLLAMGRGQPRTPDQLTRLLHHAGFARCRPVATRMPLLVQVMTARRV
jgi:demethylspheroidene O-methyltransferase